MKGFHVLEFYVPLKLIASNSDHQPDARSQLSVINGFKYEMVSLCSKKKIQFSFDHKTCTLYENIVRIHEETKENIY